MWAWPAVLQHPRQLPVCGHALSPRLPPGLQPRVRAAAPPPLPGEGWGLQPYLQGGLRGPEATLSEAPGRATQVQAPWCGVRAGVHAALGRQERMGTAAPHNPGTQARKHRTHTARGRHRGLG